MSYNWMGVNEEMRLLDQVRQRQFNFDRYYAQATPTQGQMAGLYADAYPWMAGDAVQSLVAAGVSPDDPIAQMLASEAAFEAEEESGFEPSGADMPESWWEVAADFAFGWAKPVVRAGFTVLSTPWQEMQALFSAVGASLVTDDPELQDWWRNYTEKGYRSAGVIALQDLLNPDKSADLGDGWLPGGDVWDQREESKYRMLVDGDFVTPGRLIARTVGVEQGTLAYNLLSGGFDAVSGVVLDPTSMFLGGAPRFLGGAGLGRGGVAGATRAVRTFQSDPKAAAVGLIPGVRRTVNPEQAVNHYLHSPLGQRTVDWFTDTEDFTTIWNAIRRSDVLTAQRLTAARTTEETKDILFNTLGTVVRQRPNPGFVSRGMGRFGGVSHQADYGSLFGAGARVARNVQGNPSLSRLFADLPNRTISPYDVEGAAHNLYMWMRNARFPEETIRKHMAALGRHAQDNMIPSMSGGIPSVGAGPGQYSEMLNLVKRVMDDADGLLVREWGVAPERAKRLTSLFDRTQADLRAFDVDDARNARDMFAYLRVAMGPDEYASHVRGLGYRLSDDGVTILDVSPTPGLISELVNDVVNLPDAKAIRRLTPTVRRMQKLMDSDLWKAGVDGLDVFMSNVWKPLQLLRGAWSVRVLGEEQLRMTAAGYDSVFNHPIRAVAFMFGLDPHSKLGRRIADVSRRTLDPKARHSLTGEEFGWINEHLQAMQRSGAGWRGLPGEVVTGQFVKVRKGDPHFYQGWAEEIGFMSRDPVMAELANSVRRGTPTPFDHVAVHPQQMWDDGVRAVKDWFWDGGGEHYRRQWAKVEGHNLIATRREVADAFIDHVYVDRLRRRTGNGDRDLLNLVADPESYGISMRGFGLDGETSLSKVLSNEYADIAPEAVKLRDVIRSPMEKGQAWRHMADRWIEHGFNMLMTHPTNFLGRSPVFRQAYLRRVGELMGSATKKVQDDILGWARRELGANDDVVKALQGIARKKGAGTRLGTIDDVDDLAKAFALGETKNLLYDLSKRSQIFDMLRVIFPFGEAWKEILTAWTRILRDRPHVVRRAQQGIHGLRTPSVFGQPDEAPDLDPDTGEVIPGNAGRGFFWQDPSTGEEMFTYPGGGLAVRLAMVGQNLIGGDVTGAWEALTGEFPLLDEGGPLGQGTLQLTGRASGLNLVAGSILPGFGPVVQIPAGALIPQTPSTDRIRELLLPFGQRSLRDQIVPAWMQKILDGLSGDPESHRLFANLTTDVMRALYATGNYSINTHDDANRLLDTATGMAQALFFIRGSAQFVLPTGPQLTWSAQDVEGNLVPVSLMIQDYRRLVDEHGGDQNEAWSEWMGRYGAENVMSLIPKSRSIVPRPSDPTGANWIRSHPDLAREFALTIGLFAPEVPGEFDFTAYYRSFEESIAGTGKNARVRTTPAEQVLLANDFLGRVQFEQAKRVYQSRPTPEMSLWLAGVRDKIADEYPGFDSWIARAQWEQRPKPDDMITELRKAILNPTLAQTDAGQGTKKYLSAIEQAEQMVRMLPGNVRRYQQAKTAEPVRMWLRLVARQIITEHPDFARVWYSVFERELADDLSAMTYPVRR